MAWDYEKEKEDYAKEYALETSIDVCAEFGKTLAETVSFIMKRFGLSEEEATERASHRFTAGA